MKNTSSSIHSIGVANHSGQDGAPMFRCMGCGIPTTQRVCEDCFDWHIQISNHELSFAAQQRRKARCKK